jgi:hypothetical protein
MEAPVWKETRPGRWERPQSFLEKSNIITRDVPNAIGRDNWAKHAIAKLQFDSSITDPAACLRIAWKQVRYNHPEIAAFPYGGKYIYRIGDTVSIDLWVTATFSVFENTADNLLGRIPRNEQMMCYWLPKSSEVVIWSPHYRVDARGAIYCLNFLCESLANMNPDLVFGGCAKNLSPSIETTLKVTSEATPELEEQARRRLAALSPGNFPALELKPTLQASAPGRTKRHFIRLSKDETNEIVSHCAFTSMRLDAVLHAALVNAVAKLAPPQEASKFMATYHSNLRALIPEDVVERYAPTSFTSVITTPVSVSPTTNFESYYAQLAPIHAKGYAPHLKSSAIFYKKLGENPKADTMNMLQPRFAYLGVVDDQVIKNVSNGRIIVKDFWIGPETLTMQLMVHTWLWEDQITLSICYNENYWDQALAASVVDTMKTTLMTELF